MKMSALYGVSSGLLSSGDALATASVNFDGSTSMP
jgi:hypothetical protein